MDLRIGGIIKLSQNDRTGGLLLQFICLGNGALHPLCPFGQNQFRSISL